MSRSERDTATLRRERIKAFIAGLIEPTGVRSGSVRGSRSIIETDPKSRRRCSCGCGKRATHVGLGDGLALTIGCEMKVRRWVRDGYPDPFAELVPIADAGHKGRGYGCECGAQYDKRHPTSDHIAHLRALLEGNPTPAPGETE